MRIAGKMSGHRRPGSRFSAAVACSAAAMLAPSAAARTRAVNIPRYEWERGDKAQATLAGEHTSVTYVKFSPDRKYLVACGYRKAGEVVSYSCVLWDVDALRAVRTFKVKDPAREHTNAAIVSKAGASVTTVNSPARKGFPPHVLVKWDAATGAEKKRIPLPESGVYTFSVSRDQRWYAGGIGAKQAAGPKGHLACWDAATGKLLKRTYCSTPSVSNVAIAPGKRHVVVGGYDGELEIWYLSSGKKLFHRRAHADTLSLKGRAFKDMVMSVAVSPDSRYAASGSMQGRLKMWRLNPFAEVWSVKSTKAYSRALAFSADGKRLLAGCADGVLKVVDTAKGDVVRLLRTGPKDVAHVDISTDGQYLAAGLYSGKIRVHRLSRIAYR